MRPIIQFLLIAPTILTPVAWMFLLHGSPPFQEEMLREAFPDRTTFSVLLPKLAFFVCTDIGLAALWMSVIIGREKDLFRLRSLFIFGLAVGLAFDCWMLWKFYSEPPRYNDWPVILFLAWLLGGPLIVGSWNLAYLLKKEPNQPAPDNERLRARV